MDKSKNTVARKAAAGSSLLAVSFSRPDLESVLTDTWGSIGSSGDAGPFHSKQTFPEQGSSIKMGHTLKSSLLPVQCVVTLNNPIVFLRTDPNLHALR